MYAIRSYYDRDRDLVVSVQARNLFDQIDLPLDVGSKQRHLDHQGIGLVIKRFEADRSEIARDLRSGEVQAEQIVAALQRDGYLTRS